jgi:ENTH domain
MDTIKKAVASLKDRITRTPLERTILEVCSDENWGCSNTMLHEIAERTFNHEDRLLIMKNVWELLKSPSKEWRRIYKVLNLIEHLLKFGSGACMHEIQDEAFKIRMLQDFSFRESGEEKGIGVRDKSKYLTSLLADRKLLEEEREKAKKTWSKFSGISSENNYGRNDSSYRSDPYDSYQRDSRNDDRSHDYYRKEEKTENYQSFTRDPGADIFKPAEIKTVKAEPKPTIWDQEPGKLPLAPKIKPPSSFTPVSVSSLFEVPDIKPVSQPNPSFNLLTESFPSRPAAPAFPSASDALGNLFTTSDTAPVFAEIPKSFPGAFSSATPAPEPFTNIYIPPAQPAPAFAATKPPTYASFTSASPVYNPNPVYSPNPSVGYSSKPVPNDFSQTPNKPYVPEPSASAKIHFNLGNTGATMEQLKIYGKSGFTDFQSAPLPKPAPVDLESKLINLDDLGSGQPKPKETYKSRW